MVEFAFFLFFFPNKLAETSEVQFEESCCSKLNFFFLLVCGINRHQNLVICSHCFVVCFGRHLQRFQVPLRSKEGGCLTISILENLSERENLTKCIWPEKGVWVFNYSRIFSSFIVPNFYGLFHSLLFKFVLGKSLCYSQLH